MPVSIELYFDPVSEERLLAWWDLLAAAGGRTKRLVDGRPHVSLAVCESLDFTATSALLAEFAASHATFQMMLGAVGVFPASKPILFLAPKVTPELLTLQRDFLARFEAHTASLWEHYSADRWMPHCTMATVPARALLGDLVTAATSLDLPLTCTVVEIGLVDPRPVFRRFVAPLSDQGVQAPSAAGDLLV